MYVCVCVWCVCVAVTPQSVQRLSTFWAVRGSNPCGGRDFRTHSDREWTHPTSVQWVPGPSGGETAGVWI